MVIRSCHYNTLHTILLKCRPKCGKRHEKHSERSGTARCNDDDNGDVTITEIPHLRLGNYIISITRQDDPSIDSDVNAVGTTVVQKWSSLRKSRRPSLKETLPSEGTYSNLFLSGKFFAARPVVGTFGWPQFRSPHALPATVCSANIYAATGNSAKHSLPGASLSCSFKTRRFRRSMRANVAGDEKTWWIVAIKRIRPMRTTKTSGTTDRLAKRPRKEQRTTRRSRGTRAKKRRSSRRTGEQALVRRRAAR